MHYFKKNLLKFSNGHIHLILGPILKTWVLFYSLEQKIVLSSSYSRVFIWNVRLFAHGWKSQIFSVLAKENSFILQYAAMFDKRNIYWWNRHFILKILV